MDKVGKSMENFKASKDFLKVVYDAFRAHKAVYSKCKILHCDISAADILVTADGKGFLSDWDLARTIEAIESVFNAHSYQGTWRFMSSLLLAAPAKFHTVQDDIESFFWVTVHTSMCFLPNSWTSHIKAVMNYIFDEATVGLHPTAPIGGTGKLCNVSSFQPLSMPLKIRDNRPLSEFVERSRRLVNSLYIEEGEVRSHIFYETTERDREREREIYFAFQKKLDSIPLCDHALFEPIFIDALDADDWPVNDSAHDYFQEAVQKSAEKRKAEEMQDYLEALEEGTREKKPYKALVQLSGNQDVAIAEDPPTAVHSDRRRSARIVALSSKSSTKAIPGKSKPPRNRR
ncbi:hypothetical protein CPC08DRAFT_821664 [Agrocybe pediades]|nr:hypothetical protein CPC08DRAFT_821664 [Agrocybe pediades]